MEAIMTNTTKKMALVMLRRPKSDAFAWEYVKQFPLGPECEKTAAHELHKMEDQHPNYDFQLSVKVVSNLT